MPFQSDAGVFGAALPAVLVIFVICLPGLLPPPDPARQVGIRGAIDAAFLTRMGSYSRRSRYRRAKKGYRSDLLTYI
jgi:hypothetical protein